jgi:hypothetical protein
MERPSTAKERKDRTILLSVVGWSEGEGWQLGACKGAVEGVREWGRGKDEGWQLGAGCSDVGFSEGRLALLGAGDGRLAGAGVGGVRRKLGAGDVGLTVGTALVAATLRSPSRL